MHSKQTLTSSLAARFCWLGAIVALLAIAPAVRAQSLVYSTGTNSYGELGDGTLVSRTSPQAVFTGGVLAGKKILHMAASCGDSSATVAVAVADDGLLYGWGYGSNGQLGGVNTTVRTTPVAVPMGALAGKTIVQLALGSYHALALTSEGTVYGWGTNSNWQLGVGNSSTQPTPLAVLTTGALNGKRIVRIAAGSTNSYAVDDQGAVYSWGGTSEGALGNPASDGQTPNLVDMTGVLAGKTVVDVAAGFSFAIARTSDGQLFGWGHNSEGELGDNTTGTATAPVAVYTGGVLNGKTVSKIAVGFYTAGCLTTEGKSYMWGGGSLGQMGNGSSNSINPAPGAVTTNSGPLVGKTLTDLVMNQSDVMALDSTGQAYGWGTNGTGTFGNGTTAFGGIGVNASSTPVTVMTSGALRGRTMSKLVGGGNTCFYALAAPTTGAFEISNIATSSNVSGTYGSSFRATAGSRVTALGTLDYSTGLTTPRQVGLWDASGTLLASTTVSSGDPRTGFFRYHTLSTPVTLLAGQDYVIGTAFPSSSAVTSSTTPLATGGVGYSAGTEFQFLGTRSVGGTTLTFPTTSSALTVGYYAANLQSTPITTPTVTTPTYTDVTHNQARLGGNVTVDGGGTITARGVVYARTSVNADPQLGGSGVSSQTTGGTTGTFATSVSGLGASTGYTFKAFASNSQGTSYTSATTFTTSPTPNSLPTVAATGAGAAGTTGFDNHFTGGSRGLPAGWTALSINDVSGTFDENGTTVRVTDFRHQQSGVQDGPTLMQSAALGPVTSLTLTTEIAAVTAAAGTRATAIAAVGNLGGYVVLAQFDTGTKQFKLSVFNGPTNGQWAFPLPAGEHLPAYAGGAVTLVLTAGLDRVRLSSPTAGGFDSGEMLFSTALDGGGNAGPFASLAQLGSNAGVLLGLSYDGSGADMSSVSMDFDRVTLAATYPAGSGPATLTLAEGTTGAQVGTFSDADGNGTVTLSASPAGLGTVTQDNAAGTWSWSPAAGFTAPSSTTVTITATDAANATATATFTFVATGATTDTTPPVVTLNGAATLTLEAGGTFTDPGAMATDAVDGALTPTVSGAVNAALPGSYVLTYSATDAASNTGSTTRTVNVVDTTAPVVSAPGAGFSPLSVTTAPGVPTVALPDYTGQLVAMDAVGVTLRTQTPAAGTAVAVGTRAVSLTAADAAGNLSNAVSFDVTVVAGNTAPTVAVDAVSGAGVFSAAGSLATARYYHTASVLADGKVLVTGGNNGLTLSSAELYQPASNTWTVAGSLGTARYYHTASVLADGRVLVTGGDGSNGRIGRLASAELYDPVSNTWTPAASLATARDFHTASVLADGRVLVTGGNNGSGVLASAELYDRVSDTWTPAGSLTTAREYHTASILADGRVLVTGGNDGVGSLLASAELYDPVSNTWTSARSLAAPRSQHTASVLADGRVLVVAGSGNGLPRRTAELYNPATNTWTAAGSLAESGYRYLHTASVLADGRVLVAGGSGSSLAVSSAELYNPATNAWTEVGSLASARFLHKASVLANGKVLVTGGSSGSVAVGTAELYGSPAVVLTGAEGVPVTQTGTFSDAEGNATVTLTASSGTVTQNNAAGTWSWTATGADGPAANPVTITATDSASGVATAGFTFTVSNAVPTVAITAPATADEDTAVSYSFTAADGSALDQAAGFAWSLSYGDGTTEAVTAGTASPLARTHTFTNPGTYNVTLTATDKDGGVSLAAAKTITILDATKPVLTGVPIDQLLEATSAAGATASFSGATATDNVTLAPVVTYSPASGSTFALGANPVTVTATDEAGNFSTATFTVTVQDTTAPVISGVPANMTVPAAGALVTFTSPTASDLVDGSRIVTCVPPSGSTFPVGTTTVACTASDTRGNQAAATFSVTVTAPEVTAPTTTITSGPAATAYKTTATFTFSANKPGATFAYGLDGSAPVACVSPLTLSELALGSHTFSVFATDLLGNVEATPATRTWTVVPPLVDPQTTALFSKGAAVPGAGVTGSGVPAGATWLSFGVPAIDDAGKVAFLGTFKVGLLTVTGVFAGTPDGGLKLLAKKGDAAPAIADGVFSVFKDPILAPNGAVAFGATLANATGKTGAVATTTNSTLWFDADGAGSTAPVLIARTGAANGGAAGVTNATWKAFTSVALSNGALAFSATMNVGPGSVTLRNDAGLWVYRPAASTLELALREGDSLEGSTITIISSLTVRAGLAGAGHWLGNDGSLVARVTRANLSNLLVKIPATGGTPEVLARTSLVAPFFAWGGGYAVTALGLPSVGSGLPAFLATIKEPTEVPFFKGLFADQGAGQYALVRGNGRAVPGVDNSVYSGFGDPDYNDQKAAAFIGTISNVIGNLGVTSASNTGIWVFAGEVSGGLSAAYPKATGHLVAREGGIPPGVASLAGGPVSVLPDAQWKTFTSLALPDGGAQPLFVATMVSSSKNPATGKYTLPGPGGVTLANDMGLWGMDSQGAVRLLVREGDVIGGKTIKTFAALSAVTGSPGQARSFNAVGQVIYRATCTDGSQALVRVRLP